MINVGLVGADSRMAGELLRILVNHPDVELLALCAPGKSGMQAADFHHGLTGELDLPFTELFDPAGLDLVFIDAHSALATHMRSDCSLPDSLRVIDMSHGPVPKGHEEDPIYGLSELNRRTLAKESHRAVVPRSLAALLIVSILPLGSNLMLPKDLTAEVAIPDDLAVSEKLMMAAKEAEHWLSRVQASFNGKVNYIVGKRLPDSARAMSLTLRIPSAVDLELLKEMFRKQYEDHHLTFVTDSELSPAQVEGTDKILIRLAKEDADSLTIEAIADARMRGGAGDAVHIMNLMFGLFETTGLKLKANAF